jgi:ribose 5-phosphate isomerase B
MRIAVGADHAGFEMKDEMAAQLAEAGHAVIDLGTNSSDSVDYPDFAAAVGRAVLGGRADRGIVFCGSGAGAAIAANKLTGIRCAQATDTYTAHQGVEHDDVNVIAMAARVIGPALAWEIIEAFIKAEFVPKERYVRRLAKVSILERERA